MTKIAGTGFGSDPNVRGTDLRIRIHIKMSCIRNTVFLILLDVQLLEPPPPPTFILDPDSEEINSHLTSSG